MRVDDLRTGLDGLAGPPPQAPEGGLRDVRRAAHRRRLLNGAVATCAVVAVAITGVVVVNHNDAGRVSPTDSPTITTIPPPPSLDPRAVFDQPRIGVGDHTGKVRGTIPTSAYKLALGITPDGSPPPQVRDNTPVPVVTDDGRIDGYWLPCYGFVERTVVEVHDFDPDSYCNKQNAKDDAEWWAGLTPEQRQQVQSHGIQPPSTTTNTTP